MISLMQCIALNYGFGRHIYIWGQIKGPLKKRQWLRILYIFSIMLYISLGITKLAV